MHLAVPFAGQHGARSYVSGPAAQVYCALARILGWPRSIKEPLAPGIQIAEHWPTACAEIDELIGDLYAVERLVPGRFPGDAPQALRQQLRQGRSRPILDRIKTWATEQVGLPRSEFGKAVRYMLERWTGLTRFVDDPCIPLDNNSAYAARGISAGMPRARLCRVRSTLRRSRGERPFWLCVTRHNPRGLLSPALVPDKERPCGDIRLRPKPRP